jgi:hypothetical protein
VEGKPAQLPPVQLHLHEPRRHTWRDWAFLLLMALVLTAIFALPIIVLTWLVKWLVHH